MKEDDLKQRAHLLAGMVTGAASMRCDQALLSKDYEKASDAAKEAMDAAVELEHVCAQLRHLTKKEKR
jgi:hypothetical protein